MTTIIFSANKPFLAYVRHLLPEGAAAMEVTDDAECLAALEKNPGAVLVLDVHSRKPVHQCRSLTFLNTMVGAGFNQTKAILLTWLTPGYIFQNTDQNSFSIPPLVPKNRDRLYFFRQLPILRGELKTLLYPTPQTQSL